MIKALCCFSPPEHYYYLRLQKRGSEGALAARQRAAHRRGARSEERSLSLSGGAFCCALTCGGWDFWPYVLGAEGGLKVTNVILSD